MSFPVSFDSKLSITSNNFEALKSGVKRFSDLTFFSKGLLRKLLTVPGCKPTKIAFGFVLLISILKFLIIWLRAVLLDLYEYQPPNLFSEILPTLALKKAKMLLFLLFKYGMKYFPTNVGPIVLIDKTLLSTASDRL